MRLPQQMRRIVLQIALLCTLILLLTACGPEDEPTAVAEPVTLKMVTLLDQSIGEKVAIEQYLEDNPTITMERNGYRQNPAQYLLTSPPPDIMGMGPSNILASAARQDLLMDLTDLWAQSGLLESYPENFRALSEVNGKQYYMPTGYSWVGIYYNVAIFDQFDLQPPQTWDELMGIADTLLASGETPFSIAGRDPVATSLWLDYLNLRLNGAEFHAGILRGEESYDDPRMRQVFEVWQSLFENEYFIENITSLGSIGSLTATIRGDNGELGRNKAVMILSTPSTIAELPDTFRGELDFFRFPIIDPSLNQGEVVPSIGYMIPLESPNRLEAMDLISHMSSADVQELLFQPDGNFPTFIPVNSEIIQDNFSDGVMRGISIVESVDFVTTQYFWSSPSVMQGRISTTIRTFFSTVGRDRFDIDALLLDLEETRIEAVNEGAFSN